MTFQYQKAPAIRDASGKKITNAQHEVLRFLVAGGLVYQRRSLGAPEISRGELSNAFDPLCRLTVTTMSGLVRAGLVRVEWNHELRRDEWYVQDEGREKFVRFVEERRAYEKARREEREKAKR